MTVSAISPSSIYRPWPSMRQIWGKSFVVNRVSLSKKIRAALSPLIHRRGKKAILFSYRPQSFPSKLLYNIGNGVIGRIDQEKKNTFSGFSVRRFSFCGKLGAQFWDRSRGNDRMKIRLDRRTNEQKSDFFSGELRCKVACSIFYGVFDPPKSCCLGLGLVTDLCMGGSFVFNRDLRVQETVFQVSHCY